MRNNYQRGKRTACVAGIILLIAVCAFLYPRYRAFVEADYQETCYDARYYVGVYYWQSVRSQTGEGIQEDAIDYEQTLRDVVADRFAFTLQEDGISTDLCRAGGVCVFVLDEETHHLVITCSHENHEIYDDSVVTEELLDYVTW